MTRNINTGQKFTSLPLIAPANPGAMPVQAGTLSTAMQVAGGTLTLNSGSAVTVADAGVTANSIIILTLKTAGGTVAAPFVATITPGTGFTVNSGGSDTSVLNWARIG